MTVKVINKEVMEDLLVQLENAGFEAEWGLTEHEVLVTVNVSSRALALERLADNGFEDVELFGTPFNHVWRISPVLEALRDFQPEDEEL